MLHFEGTTAQQRLSQFLTESFQTAADVPFSFTYKGISSREFLKDWECQKKEDELLYRSPDGLTATVTIQTFEDFPAVEWLLTFENTSDIDSGLIEDVYAMDFKVEASPFRTAGTQQYGALDNILYYNSGSDCKADDFIPCQEILHSITARQEMEFTCTEGRPTSGSHGAFPYFNLKTLDKGVFFAIGWSGQWKMKMTMDRRNDTFHSTASYRFTGGMDGISTVLYPGEKIRTARILLMPWDGAIEDAFNQSRRFMLKYHTPQMNGQPALLPLSLGSWGHNARKNMSEIDLWAKTELPLDTYWIDAGWYGPEGTHCDNPLHNDWNDHVGWYSHDPSRYPNGLGEVGQYAHDHGLRFLLWVEPDRAVVGTPSHAQHPEYYLDYPIDNSRMLNLGNEEAYQWALNMLSDKIETYHMDVLRIDYNVGPLSAWRANDKEGRRGMTEIRAVENFYRLWGELRRKYPNLLIDNCASGGRRLDFEANTYSVTLHRTDYLCYADSSNTGMQVQTAGMAPFIPLSGMGVTAYNWYSFISCLSAGKSIAPEQIAHALENEGEMKELLRMWEVLKRVRPMYVGDFYMFTSVTLNEQDWYAYEMNRPEDGTACVVSARRSQCALTGACYKLRGLESDALYLLEDGETGNELGKMTGAQLMNDGLTVSLLQPETASLIFVTKEK